MHLDPAHLHEIQRILTFWAPGVPAFAYGSRVHGRNLKPLSDVDICLKGETPVSEKLRWQLRDAFDISDLPMRVDLVDWHDLSPEFQARIAGDLEEISPQQAA